MLFHDNLKVPILLVLSTTGTIIPAVLSIFWLLQKVTCQNSLAGQLQAMCQQTLAPVSICRVGMEVEGMENRVGRGGQNRVVMRADQDWEGGGFSYSSVLPDPKPLPEFEPPSCVHTDLHKQYCWCRFE